MESYIYIFNCHEDERELSYLEKRMFFGVKTNDRLLKSNTRICPSRSPFIKGRLRVIYEAKMLADLQSQCDGYDTLGKSFKIQVIKMSGLQEGLHFTERKSLESEIGKSMRGKANLKQPELTLAILKKGDYWYFGEYEEGEPVWLKHQQKPKMYSTALGTRLARAVVNIAVPHISNQQVIDPSCGIGTVLIEACSMNIRICGSDINPLAVIGTRENLAFFGYEAVVKKENMLEIKESYDTAIIDMPYNLCSVISNDKKRAMMMHARKFTKRLVLVTVEPMDDHLIESGFTIIDRCTVTKGHFQREVLVCE
ncbi:TRM11 family SAM-dependent methyltransferase [Alkalihalobacillus pseudalcaliphilus]|uniref:TRM11 family SAM-dependent methyltransferase n=1 Tax=Alkalihalobacillus pseudalcaliphilus TaxID=79884 RepID=UPI00064E0183|nr:RNA methyltransferase [Alkalihalobacillus pseudalcaliphilus]KMK75084.1 RNA methyltransferase [Alkalihalobacillus pseudalcaliphilus]